jgi:tetratricopeptide (TPR) repeat protein
VFWEHIAGREPSLNNYANLGLAYLNVNNSQKARTAFLKALQYVSESPGGTSRGDILLMLGDDAGAIQAFETVLAHYKDSKEFGTYIVSWQLYNNLSKAYMNTGRYPEAIHAIEDSIRLKPDNAGLYNSLGVLYGETKQFDKAIRAFERAMAIDPEYGFAPLNLARTYLNMGDRKSAERYLAIVGTKFPNLRGEAEHLLNNQR